MQARLITHPSIDTAIGFDGLNKSCSIDVVRYAKMRSQNHFVLTDMSALMR